MRFDGPWVIYAKYTINVILSHGRWYILIDTERKIFNKCLDVFISFSICAFSRLNKDARKFEIGDSKDLKKRNQIKPNKTRNT